MENKLTKKSTVNKVGRSDFVMMGDIRLRQPLPTNKIDNVDPFLLLHHYGPFEISSRHNPLDLGPHPHRGFEPATILLQGEQLHRDSLGNESIVKAGDVQWTTAGRGIVHAEGPSKEFVEKGGVLEGIQLWVNLPANKKMIPANYQHVRKEEFPEKTSDDGKVVMRVLAGSLSDLKGSIQAQTDVDLYFIEGQSEGEVVIHVKESHQASLYLIEGSVVINDVIFLKKNENQFATFEQDGEGFRLKISEDAKLLFFSGVPLKEKVVSYGPYVMNSQTEILEAMRDFQMGKMGFLPRN